MADVFEHPDACNVIKRFVFQFTVVFKDYFSLTFKSKFLDLLVNVVVLFLTQGNSSNFQVIFLGGRQHQRSPATTNIKHCLARLRIELL